MEKVFIIFCKKCGNELRDGIKFCPKCGTPVPQMIEKNVVENLEISKQDDIKKPVENVATANHVEAKKSKKGRVVILIIAIVLAMALGGVATAIYFMKNNEPQKIYVNNSDNSDDGDTEEKEETDKETDKDTDKETDKTDGSEESSEKAVEAVEGKSTENVRPKIEAEPEEKPHTYQIVAANSTWTDAYKNAKDIKGGSLVNIESQGEMDEILKLIDSQGYGKYVFWIGSMRRGTSYDYYWVDGNGNDNGSELNESTFWLKEEPSYIDSRNNLEERYVTMFYSGGESRWVWNDVPNDISQYYSGKLAYIVEVEDE